MKKVNKYAIQIATNNQERRMALGYIAEKFWQTYGTRPPENTAPRSIFIAKNSDKIVGALALHFGDTEKLPHESLFSFNRENIPLQDYDSKKCVYYSRWCSSVENLGLVLWLEASNYALNKGNLFSASVGKPFIYDNFMKWFSCEWLPITNAEMKKENVATSDYNYFFTDPQPSPYVGLLRQQIAKLPEVVSGFYEKNHVIINL